VGEIVATVKHPYLHGKKLLIVQPVDHSDRKNGKPVLAVDCVDVGPGERILLSDEGGAAGLVLGGEGPVRAVIVGRIDEVSTSGSPSEKSS
jgi:microcompartment protein CcmK/EutM